MRLFKALRYSDRFVYRGYKYLAIAWPCKKYANSFSVLVLCDQKVDSKEYLDGFFISSHCIVKPVIRGEHTLTGES